MGFLNLLKRSPPAARALALIAIAMLLITAVLVVIGFSARAGPAYAVGDVGVDLAVEQSTGYDATVPDLGITDTAPVQPDAVVITGDITGADDIESGAVIPVPRSQEDQFDAIYGIDFTGEITGGTIDDAIVITGDITGADTSTLIEIGDGNGDADIDNAIDVTGQQGSEVGHDVLIPTDGQSALVSSVLLAAILVLGSFLLTKGRLFAVLDTGLGTIRGRKGDGDGKHGRARQHARDEPGFAAAIGRGVSSVTQQFPITLLAKTGQDTGGTRGAHPESGHSTQHRCEQGHGGTDTPAITVEDRRPAGGHDPPHGVKEGGHH